MQFICINVKAGHGVQLPPTRQNAKHWSMAQAREQEHEHGHHGSCACAAHKRPLAAREEAPRKGALGLLGTLAPALACAVCPACLSTYAKVLSVLGVGAAITETQHTALLSFAIGSSIVLSGVRSWRAWRIWPLLIAVVGCALVLAGHLSSEIAAVEWLGIAILLGGGLAERTLTARAARAASALATPR